MTTLFNEHDMDKSGTIEYEEFLKIVKDLLTYDEMKPIFMKYSSYSRGTKLIVSRNVGYQPRRWTDVQERFPSFFDSSLKINYHLNRT